MYHISCDSKILFDPREDELSVDSPTVSLAVNTVGEGSFTIHQANPYYSSLQMLKSVFEVADDVGVVFRGRMTHHSREFYNSKYVDMEGMMACFNDSIVRPYSFPADWQSDQSYIDAAASGNVVEFFLNWLIEQHNEQVTAAQRFKLGRVTVEDPNNYISRSDSSYPSTWEVLRSKLFESTLGGNLCIRYEADGNYIDYLSAFELTNTQEIVFGQNLLDLTSDLDAQNTFSAVVPIGATVDDVKTTIAGLPDCDITADIVKRGDMIYSKKAVEAYGFICAPVSDTTWDEVTSAENLLTKAVEWLTSQGMKMTETVEVSAVDLQFTDDQINSFRIYRNVTVRSEPHGHVGTYELPKLVLDLQNPQNTKITVGTAKKTMVDISNRHNSSNAEIIESVKNDVDVNRAQTSEVMNLVITQSTEMVNTCNQILLSALESYVETRNFEAFKEVLQADFGIWAEGISGRVSAAEERIENVDGDLQAKFNQIVKYFTFDLNGLTIGQVDNPNRIVIDNDEITIYHGDRAIQAFKADGTALIPILTVSDACNLLGLKITSDDTHINFDL